MGDAVLTREQILGANDSKTEEVPVPEWGGTVLVRSMEADEKDAWELDCLSGRFKKPGIRAALVSLAMVDESGNRLFTDADVKALGKKSPRALDRVFDAASRLNALRQKDIEELEKNSEGIPADSSPST
jgi:hypothetical protein